MRQLKITSLVGCTEGNLLRWVFPFVICVTQVIDVVIAYNVLVYLIIVAALLLLLVSLVSTDGAA